MRASQAFVLGRRDGDGSVTRDEALANAKAIVDATDLPVAADLENGYGHSPEAAAETIRLAGEVAGLAGPRISCTAAQIWTIRSAACARSRLLGLTCSTRRGSPRRRTFGPSARRCASRSML